MAAKKRKLMHIALTEIDKLNLTELTKAGYGETQSGCVRRALREAVRRVRDEALAKQWQGG